MTLEQLDIQEDMSKEDILQHIFQFRKKLINRQNSPDIQKRAEAEIQLVRISAAENIVENLSEEKRNVSFYLGTWLCAEKHNCFNEDFNRTLIAASEGDKNCIEQITRELCGQWNENTLGKQWKALSEEAGNSELSQMGTAVEKTDAVDNNHETMHNTGSDMDCDSNSSQTQNLEGDTDLLENINKLLTDCWNIFELSFCNFIDGVEKFITSEEERKRMIHSFFQNLEELLVGKSEESSNRDVFYKRNQSESEEGEQEKMSDTF